MPICMIYVLMYLVNDDLAMAPLTLFCFLSQAVNTFLRFLDIPFVFRHIVRLGKGRTDGSEKSKMRRGTWRRFGSNVFEKFLGFPISGPMATKCDLLASNSRGPIMRPKVMRENRLVLGRWLSGRASDLRSSIAGSRPGRDAAA